MDQTLLAELGVETQEAEHLEKAILGQALADKDPTAVSPAADTTTPEGVAEKLLAVQQEVDTLVQAISAQQQQADEADWASDNDEATKEAEISNKQFEAAVMQQRLDSLQQQQQNLQQQLDGLPAEQKHQALLHYQEQLEAAQQQQQRQGRKKGRQRGAGSGSSRGAATAGRGRKRTAASVAAVASTHSGLDGLEAAVDTAARSAAPKLVETERDRLIRLGLLTPFDKLDGFEMKVQGGTAPAQQVQHVTFQGGRTVAQHQQQQRVLQQPVALQASAVGPGPHSSQSPAVPPQHQQQGVKPSPGSTTPPAAPVDEQWALLQQRAQQQPAGPAVDISSIPDLARQVGRSGAALTDLMAKATQQAVEMGVTNRARAVLMQPHEVPRQERELIKVNPMLWRAGAASQSRVVSKRPPRRSTLPRQKRKRHKVALFSTDAAAAAVEEAEEGERKRQRQQQQQQQRGEGVAESEDDWVTGSQQSDSNQEDGELTGESDYAPSDGGIDAAGAMGGTATEGALELEDGVDDDSDSAGQQRGRIGRAKRRGRLRQGGSSANEPPSNRASAAAAAGRSRETEPSSEEDYVDDLMHQQQEAAAERDDLADYDDVDDAVYQTRLERYQEQLELKKQQKLQQQQQQQDQQGHDGAASEGGGADSDDVVFDGGFRVPGSIWSALFDFQRTGVKWLWELHNQRAGGIIGDEMGLGKTIQVIGYLAGLHHSGMWRPSLVVAPATVLQQWMTELRTWYPPLRVMLLHESGKSPYGAQRPDKQGILDLALSAGDCSLVLTTYDQLRLQRELLLPVRWGVAVLDEGHKIRNPDAEVTLAAKQLQTVHRLIMSGSPIQNRLSELWSLFDFIFPGKLGTLPVFTAQFAIPITIGGYTNASKLQVQTAYRCAVVLRDLINPYLLRRRKADVAAQLPKKTETVLFCTLTEQQRDLYRAYINSKDVGEILAGQRQALAGIDVLRKICNHPDLLQRTTTQANEDYGSPQRSGKLQVLSKVLAAWHAEGHKVLLFTQTQQMLDIIEKHVVSQGYSYHRMDGGTAIAQRGRLMDDFNTNPNRFVFLLTTKVGGLGVNLTGANRVVIYDPDWNPSTDTQARERAWRIGQGRPVTIYRLITSGTIEEKVYHRQIYKSYLTNKVLQDPRQRRFFASRDISDLFTLADEHGSTTVKRLLGPGAGGSAAAGLSAATETGKIFSEFVGEQLLPSVAAAGVGANRSAAGGSTRPHGAAAGQQRRQQQQVEEDLGYLPDDSGAADHLPSTADAVGPGGLHSSALGRRPPAAAAAAASNSAQYEGPAGDQEVDDDARVLRDLFEGTGIRSLMDHSRIESAHDTETIKADEHAAKVAARAAEVLRQSRLACSSTAVNVPTWTGRHGSAGAGGMVPSGARGRGSTATGAGSGRSSPAAAPAAVGRGRFGQVRNPLLTASPLVRTVSPGVAAGKNSPAGGNSDGTDSEGEAAAAAGGSVGRFGASRNLFSGRQAGTTGGAAPSSAALLATMRERQLAAAAADDGQQQPPDDRGTNGGDPTAVQLAEQIVRFIQGAGGAANSELLLGHFREVLRDVDMPLFKQLLRQVARLQPVATGAGARGGGYKVWVLRDAYAALNR